ncbi:MFS transporter [Micromonospora sp. WMMD1082]|uniref:MFS transporter n=1 Tax=Micromonospora sp. WMMD1082 TaxID=3016104 RepID=UPI00241686C9|nr:MFS transporter [Micromonospora sp. WMMD1082]MDG4798647.1 MFS transporter [Micromonospora sp. WMMD1082]
MTGKRAVVALLALSGGTFLYVTNEALPIGLMLPLAADLAVPPSRVGMLVTAYGAVVVLASIPLTVVTRNVPRRRLLSVLLAGFVVTAVVSALASSFWLMLVARMAGAATQALYWAVVVPTAAALFPPHLRGRAVAVVFAGSTAALAVGVPAGAWLGELVGWRVTFLAVGGLGLAALMAIAALLPSTPAGRGHSARGTTPDARRFWLLVAVAALATTGALTAYTYVAPFVTEVGGLVPAAVGTVLLVRGVASMLGVLAIGPVVDRRPWLALTATVAVQSVALLALYAGGHLAIAAVGLVAVAGLAFAALTTALGGLVLEVAPGRSDIAAAAVSTAVNVGITGGALIGGLLLPGFGVRSTVLVGGLLSAAAVLLALGEKLLPPARTPAPVTGIRGPDEVSAGPDGQLRQRVGPVAMAEATPTRSARRPHHARRDDELRDRAPCTDGGG